MAMSAVATIKGGLFEQYGSTLSQISTTSAPRRRASQVLADKGMLDLRARMVALDGVVAGSNATKTVARVGATEDLSGVRPIEVETLINRNTTAADVTEINKMLSLTSKTTFGASPPANLDGNPLGTR